MKLSFEKIRSLLYDAIQPSVNRDGLPSCWVVEVYEDEFVYHKGSKLYRAPYKIGANATVEVGTAVEVVEETEYVPVFSESRLFACFKESGDDGVVIRKGKIFESGDYPDKGVAFDEADLTRAVESFVPVGNDLEHRSTILDGKLGSLAKVWQKGTELFGEVHVPKWLDEAIGSEPIKVSLAFDRAKKIVGNALVLRPRIEDAAIMSAFAVFTSSNSPEGPAPKDKEAMKKMPLKQAIKHLFGLDSVENLDVEVTLPEEPTTPTTPPTPAAPETPAAPTFTAPEAPTPDPSAARLAALEGHALTQAAFNFADAQIREKKALPAQREQIAAMYANAVRQDSGGGSVFSADGATLVSGASVAQLSAFFGAAPAHAFVGESFAGADVLHFGGGGTSGGMDPEKKAKLLAMTAVGKKAAEGAKAP